MVEFNGNDTLSRDGAEMPDEAFATLVKRHINLVFSSALRQVRDPHVAEEVVQSVFERLARKRGSLSQEVHLTGWLYRTTRFVALERLRADHRRQLREKAAMETLYQTPEESQWQEIEPMLDEAMAGLSEKERELVLLRYFENKSLREVGNAWGMTEDAAQKRVARALEKLRSFFAQRGATLSASALGGALTTFAVQAAPSALAPAVITAVAASASAISAAPAALGLLQFMASTKIKATALAAALLTVTSVPIVTQHRALREAREENETLHSRVEQLEAAPVAAIPPPAAADNTELERLRREAAEVHQLRGQVGVLLNANRERAERELAEDPQNNDPVRNNPTERMRLARDLLNQGNHAEALENFLWCYDEGIKHSPSFVGVRVSFLLSELHELSKVYPPALEALVKRRDAVEARILAGAEDMSVVFEMMQLNEHLEQPNRTMGLFDQLPTEHPARSSLIDVASEQFAAARRYEEIVAGSNPEARFEREQFTMGRVAGMDETIQKAMRERVVSVGAVGVESLAGAGENERARALADKVLKVDASPEVREKILKRAERAGNPQLITYLKAK